MKSKSTILIVFLVISMFLYGCGSDKAGKTSEEEQESSDLNIYTTIYPIQDFTEKIGGEHVVVESVYPPNVDTHSFEPSTKMMTYIADSDALIYNGAGIEGFVDASIDVLKKENVKLVKASEGLEMLTSGHSEEDEEGHAHEGEEVHEDENPHDVEEAHDDKHSHDDHSEHGDTDPHVWLDPIRAITIAENVKNALIELKPEAKVYFEENFLSLKKELESLDTEFKEVVEHAAKKEILISHAAYGYWEDRYGIKQIAISGMSPTQEPSQKQLTEVIETAQERNIKYIIFEANISDKISNIVKNEIGAESLYLSNLESVSEEDITNNEDYFSIMRRNLETLKKALN